jgi:hypothetical protein
VVLGAVEGGLAGAVPWARPAVYPSIRVAHLTPVEAFAAAL